MDMVGNAIYDYGLLIFTFDNSGYVSKNLVTPWFLQKVLPAFYGEYTLNIYLWKCSGHFIYFTPSGFYMLLDHGFYNLVIPSGFLNKRNHVNCYNPVIPSGFFKRFWNSLLRFCISLLKNITSMPFFHLKIKPLLIFHQNMAYL